jgi:pimeloyl-ACP methyl ester carboxylesterase
MSSIIHNGIGRFDEVDENSISSQYTAPNLFVEASNGTTYAYRRFGKTGATPVVFLQHFRGNLDNWDPALVDDIAAEREVILVDNSGVGLSTGTTSRGVTGLARDTLDFVDALGLSKIDLFGFSTGGFVAQEVVLLRPHLVRRLILAGTGPQGGRGFHRWNEQVRDHAYKDVQSGEDVFYLFFSATETSQAKGIEFVGRIFTREQDRDALPALAVRDAQAEAISDWGIPDMGKLARLAGITQPTLVANGDNDIMVPTVNSYLLAGHIPDAELIIYPDSGHGFLFQYPAQFAVEVNAFLG